MADATNSKNTAKTGTGSSRFRPWLAAEILLAGGRWCSHDGRRELETLQQTMSSAIDQLGALIEPI
jgi:hypothetical protein